MRDSLCQSADQIVKPAFALLNARQNPIAAAMVILTRTNALFAGEPSERFLTPHCVRCHEPEKLEGAIRIDQLSRHFRRGADTHHWAEAIDKVNSGEMPLKTEPQSTQDEIAAFVTYLDAKLRLALFKLIESNGFGRYAQTTKMQGSHSSDQLMSPFAIAV